MKAKDPRPPGQTIEGDSQSVASANGEESERPPEHEERRGARKSGGGFMIAAGMLVALCGGASMGGAAVMVSSGEALGLIVLYVFGAITAAVARMVYRRGGMFFLSVYAALVGMAIILGPALAMWLSPSL